MKHKGSIRVFEIPEKEFLKLIKLQGKLYNVSMWEGTVEVRLYEEIK